MSQDARALWQAVQQRNAEQAYEVLLQHFCFGGHPGGAGEGRAEGLRELQRMLSAMLTRTGEEIALNETGVTSTMSASAPARAANASSAGTTAAAGTAVEPGGRNADVTSEAGGAGLMVLSGRVLEQSFSTPRGKFDVEVRAFGMRLMKRRKPEDGGGAEPFGRETEAGTGAGAVVRWDNVKRVLLYQQPTPANRVIWVLVIVLKEGLLFGKTNKRTDTIVWSIPHLSEQEREKKARDEARKKQKKKAAEAGSASVVVDLDAEPTAPSSSSSSSSSSSAVAAAAAPGAPPVVDVEEEEQKTAQDSATDRLPVNPVSVSERGTDAQTVDLPEFIRLSQLHEDMPALVSTLTNLPLARPDRSIFRSSKGKCFIECTKRTTQGELWFLRQGLFFSKPGIFIDREAITEVRCPRSGHQTQYIDLIIEVDGDEQLEFSVVDRDELPSVTEYVKFLKKCKAKTRPASSSASSSLTSPNGSGRAAGGDAAPSDNSDSDDSEEDSDYAPPDSDDESDDDDDGTGSSSSSDDEQSDTSDSETPQKLIRAGAKRKAPRPAAATARKNKTGGKSNGSRTTKRKPPAKKARRPQKHQHQQQAVAQVDECDDHAPLMASMSSSVVVVESPPAPRVPASASQAAAAATSSFRAQPVVIDVDDVDADGP